MQPYFPNMDNSQFILMIEPYRSSLSNFALKFTNDVEDANDLMQDTMIKALRFFKTFEKGTNVKGWLYTIMKNTFINDYRKTAKRNMLLVQAGDISSSNLMYSAAHNMAEDGFAMRDIRSALNRLPRELSYPFIRYVEGYKYNEIAEELGLPIGTVKTHIHQARKHLKKYLQVYKGKKV